MKIDKKYLPSKKFIAALSITVVLILIAVALSYIKPSGTKSYNLIGSATTSPSEIDSDNDGLPDWEKVLYGIDPHNIDMAGDGIPNGEKISDELDPLKANTAPYGQEPNNKISPTLVAESQAIDNADQNLNATEKMAHDLMSNIIAAQPVNGTMDQNTQDTLVQQAFADIPQKQFAGTTTIADLNLIPVPSDTTAALKDLTTYANGYYLLTEAFEKIMGQDLALVDTSMTKNAGLDTKRMNIIISVYQYVIHNLIQLPLPALPNSSGTINDLQVINDLETLVQIDNDIITSSANSDTASIYSDLGIYNDTLNDLTGTLDAMDAMLGIKR